MKHSRKAQQIEIRIDNTFRVLLLNLGAIKMTALNVLIADDDENIREAIFLTIEKPDIRVFEAEDGLEVLKILENNKIDFLITDIMMPNIDGLELIPKVKAQFPDIKIIAVSGESSYGSNYLEMAKMFGASHIIRKPFRTSDFDEILNAA